MKEIEDIVRLHQEATRQNKKTALGTVVLVEGSSYRRPGARMLVTEDGVITGTISGGCLESDAIRKSLLAIAQQQTKLVAYNSMDDDDFTEGVQLGCNGIVYILFEPIDSKKENNPVALLEQTVGQEQELALISTFNKDNLQDGHAGTIALLKHENIDAATAENGLPVELITDFKSALLQQRSIIRHYPERQFSAFINIIKPAVQLVIAGAGNDAIPLVKLANILGWKVTIVDGRKTHANPQRFGDTAVVKVGKPAEILPQLNIHTQTAFVLLTHNYQYDITMLRLLLDKPCAYIGVLGPKKKMDKMLEELEQEGCTISATAKEKIYGPAGLDIGTETPEEIALSIIAEIKAVFAKRTGGTLRDKNGFIHDHEKPAPFVAGGNSSLDEQLPVSSIQ